MQKQGTIQVALLVAQKANILGMHEDVGTRADVSELKSGFIFQVIAHRLCGWNTESTWNSIITSLGIGLSV